MKPLLLTTMLVLLFSSCIQAQLLVYEHTPPLSGYSSSNSLCPQKERSVCAVTKTGLIIMGIATLSAATGIGFINSRGAQGANTDPGDLGRYMLAGGELFFVIGVCFAFGRSIHDAIKPHKKRISAIAPKRDQIGLAWNFR